MAKKNETLTERAITALKDGKGDSPIGGTIELEKGMKFQITGLDYITYERKNEEPIEYFALVTTQVNVSLARFMGQIGSDKLEYWKGLGADLTKEAFAKKYNVKFRSPKAFAEKELPGLIGKTIEVLCVVEDTVVRPDGTSYDTVRVAWKVSDGK
jgi:hypothetical protein